MKNSEFYVCIPLKKANNIEHQSYKKFKKWNKVGIERKERNKMGCLCNSDSLLILIL